MIPVLIHSKVGAVSGWIGRNGYDQIRLPTSGRFKVTERLADGSMFENEIEHLPIITLAGDTKWIRVMYLSGDEPANVELI